MARARHPVSVAAARLGVGERASAPPRNRAGSRRRGADHRCGRRPVGVLLVLLGVSR